jgi:hypothetical protein
MRCNICQSNNHSSAVSLNLSLLLSRFSLLSDWHLMFNLSIELFDVMEGL